MRSLLVLILLLSSLAATGLSWSDLWWRKDQQGMHLLQKGKNEQAAQTFQSPNWRAVANYRAHKYQQVEKDLNDQNDPVSKYNLGNALALQGKYQQALVAYEQAIKQQPDFKDAIYNRDLIKKLWQQKNDQNNKDEKNSPNDSKQQQQQQQQSKPPDNQKNTQDKQKNDNNQNNNNQQNSADQQPQKDPNQPGQEEQQKAKPDNSGEQKNLASHKQTQSNASNNLPSKETPSDSIDTTHQSQPESGTNLQKTQGARSSHDNETKEQIEAVAKKLDQETDQWLQQITDDPSDLLRRKILRDHLEK